MGLIELVVFGIIGAISGLALASITNTCKKVLTERKFYYTITSYILPLLTWLHIFKN